MSEPQKQLYLSILLGSLVLWIECMCSEVNYSVDLGPRKEFSLQAVFSSERPKRDSFRDHVNKLNESSHNANPSTKRNLFQRCLESCIKQPPYNDRELEVGTLDKIGNLRIPDIEDIPKESIDNPSLQVIIGKNKPKTLFILRAILREIIETIKFYAQEEVDLVSSFINQCNDIQNNSNDSLGIHNAGLNWLSPSILNANTTSEYKVFQIYRPVIIFLHMCIGVFLIVVGYKNPVLSMSFSLLTFWGNLAYTLFSTSIIKNKDTGSKVLKIPWVTETAKSIKNFGPKAIILASYTLSYIFFLAFSFILCNIILPSVLFLAAVLIGPFLIILLFVPESYIYSFSNTDTINTWGLAIVIGTISYFVRNMVYGFLLKLYFASLGMLLILFTANQYLKISTPISLVNLNYTTQVPDINMIELLTFICGMVISVSLQYI
ncbi:hypothetical protein NEOKW01_1900 [Nematocida sp. AWRm80]|nr:hypothetical protein NEOKW01_1900 [Nematocida sp. AWRm80]